MNELYLFASGFLVVFLLGLQSLNVNGGHYLAAVFTSFGIGVCNLALYKIAPNVQSATEVIAYLTGGPLAIVAAMYCHRNVFSRFKFFRK